MDMMTRRMMMSRESESDNVKEWKKILEYDFDESGKLPSPIDVSEYTEYYIVNEGMLNINSVDSRLRLSFGSENMDIYTFNASSIATKSQHAYALYNGLVFLKYQMPPCNNGNGTYDNMFQNLMSTYTNKVNPSTLSPLKFSYIAGEKYKVTVGRLTIYAR